MSIEKIIDTLTSELKDLNELYQMVEETISELSVLKDAATGIEVLVKYQNDKRNVTNQMDLTRYIQYLKDGVVIPKITMALTTDRGSMIKELVTRSNNITSMKELVNNLK